MAPGSSALEHSAHGETFTCMSKADLGRTGVYPDDGPSQLTGLLWKFPTGGHPVISSPAVSGGMVYFGSSDTLYALDAQTGQEKWKFKTGDEVDFLSGRLGWVGLLRQR